MFEAEICFECYSGSCETCMDPFTCGCPNGELNENAPHRNLKSVLVELYYTCEILICKALGRPIKFK